MSFSLAAAVRSAAVGSFRWRLAGIKNRLILKSGWGRESHSLKGLEILLS